MSPLVIQIFPVKSNILCSSLSDKYGHLYFLNISCSCMLESSLMADSSFIRV